MMGMMGTPSVHQKEPLAFLLFFFNLENGLFLSWREGDLHQVVELFVSSSKLSYHPNSFFVVSVLFKLRVKSMSNT